MTTTQFAALGIAQDLVDALAARGIPAPCESQALARPAGRAAGAAPAGRQGAPPLSAG